VAFGVKSESTSCGVTHKSWSAKVNLAHFFVSLPSVAIMVAKDVIVPTFAPGFEAFSVFHNIAFVIKEAVTACAAFRDVG
jgi:hypothetical protein